MGPEGSHVSVPSESRRAQWSAMKCILNTYTLRTMHMHRHTEAESACLLSICQCV